MRRIDLDNYENRTDSPPFQVLYEGSHLLPPLNLNTSALRTTGSYKIGPSSPPHNRLHQKSSFVILAENKAITQDSRSPPSLSPITGRISPFRGRGFKGPLPHAQISPNGPNDSAHDESCGSNKRVPVSQLGNPKQSQIPQPTRDLLKSVRKENEHNEKKSKQRAGVQEITKKDTSHSGSLGERHSSEYTRLSLKEKALVKTPEKSSVTPRLYRNRVPELTSQKTRKSPLLPPRVSVRPNESPDKKETAGTGYSTSSSKIPSKGDSIIKEAAPKQSSLSTRTGLHSPYTELVKSEKLGRKNLRGVAHQTLIKSTDWKTSRNLNQRISKETGNIEKSEQKPEDKTVEGWIQEHPLPIVPVIEPVDILEDSLGLADLLKQSYRATGTKSVVNTTTITAVQPLQIDAAAVLRRADFVDKIERIETQKRPGVLDGNEKSNSIMGKDGDTNPGQKFIEIMEGDSGSYLLQSNSNTHISNTNDESANPNDASVHTINEISTGKSSQNIDKLIGKIQDVIDNGSQEPIATVALTNDSNHLTESRLAVSNEQVNFKENHAVKVGNVVRTQANSNNSSFIFVQRENNETGIRIPDGENGDSKSVAQITEAPVKLSKSLINANYTPDVNCFESVHNSDSGVSPKSPTRRSADSVSSVRSRDTGVSLDTVRGISSAEEKGRIRFEERPQQIGTLSGNIAHQDSNSDVLTAPANREGTLKNSLDSKRQTSRRYFRCWPKMKCLACQRDIRDISLWPIKQTSTTAKAGLNPVVGRSVNKKPGRWSRIRKALRIPKLRLPHWKGRKWFVTRGRVAPVRNPSLSPREYGLGVSFQKLFANCNCKRPKNLQRGRKSVHAKQSIVSVAASPLYEDPTSKLPDVLVEHNSLMRGAIPCLPLPLAWFCLIWNVLIPGSGTFWSGLFNLCAGQPRFSPTAGARARIGAFIVNMIVGVGQLFTVLFCLVGWGWSIWWGVTMIRLARKYKRFKDSEILTGDIEAKANEATASTPGIPGANLPSMGRVR